MDSTALEQVKGYHAMLDSLKKSRVPTRFRDLSMLECGIRRNSHPKDNSIWDSSGSPRYEPSLNHGALSRPSYPRFEMAFPFSAGQEQQFSVM